MHEFLIYAILAGVGIAVSICPIGCVVLWKKVPYFADAIAHASVLGIVVALATGFDVMVGIVAISIMFAMVLIYFKRADEENIMVVVLAYAFLALGLFLLSFISTNQQVDIFSYLFGDILLVSKIEVVCIGVSSAIIVTWLCFRWKKLLLTSINEDLALVEGVNISRLKLEFFCIVAFLVGISVKIIGALLVGSILIMPATAARNFSNSPVTMLVSSTVIGIIAVLSGIGLSYYIDSPSGPSIVLASALILLVSFIFSRSFKRAD